MKITIKHYDEVVSWQKNEDQYKNQGLDETTVDEAVKGVYNLLLVYYSEDHLKQYINLD